ncbi:MAG: xanthine dehydrogenase family protein molybdopterin-binding subunit [Chloroflexi bacterium]|nr:xanthine dehydrogenase family protein molybdopterin-binding subunit [Chloroflexota bacterium]
MTNTLHLAASEIGHSRRPVEYERLLRGLGRYTTDLRRPGMLYLDLVRATHAHARIRGIRTADAAASPGVVAVLTAADLSDIRPFPTARVTPEMAVPPAPVLAAGSVHHVGEVVVAVVAATPEQARDAASRVTIDYEPLPAVVDAEAALRPSAPLAFPELATNVAYRQARTGGDVAAAFAAADTIVRLRQPSSRIAGVPMEPRAALAEWDISTRSLTVWAGVQAPYRARATLAAMLDLPETDIRVVALDVGGGFGVKGGLYAEEVLAAALTRRLGRPVCWPGGRADDLQMTQQAREQVQDLEAAFRSDGTLLGLKLTVICNLGAGARGAGAAGRTTQCLTGCYQIGAVATEMIGVYTNTVPTGAYRGAGRPEAALAIERVMDEGAAALGLDPVAIRRRNFVPPDAFPYRAPTGIVLDSGDYERGLAECLRLFDYDATRREQAVRRRRGELVGIGLATYLELTSGGWESGAVRVLASGRVEAMTGSTEQGQGHATTWAQIVGAALGVPSDWVTVRQGDTALLANGVGSFGSRSTVVGGSALALAADDIRRKMLQLAAGRLEVAITDLDWADSEAVVRGAPGRRLGFREIAALAYGGHAAGIEPGLEATRYFSASGEAYSSGAYACLVRIDRDTGHLTIERFVAVDDCGRVVNPDLVDGQVIGGIAQGLGQALWEQVRFDVDGQLLTGSLMDYALPRAASLPPLRLGRVITPSPTNPLGAKGVGEAGTIGAPPAVVNAAVDALRPLGVRHLTMPLTPERLWRALQTPASVAE